MEHSRVTKYKDYRDSFTKINAQDIGAADNIITGLSNGKNVSTSTGTLPFNEVIVQVKADEENEQQKRAIKQKKIRRIALISLIGVIFVSGMIVLGIFAFGGF